MDFNGDRTPKSDRLLVKERMKRTRNEGISDTAKLLENDKKRSSIQAGTHVHYIHDSGSPDLSAK